jgi:hypothetical protein
MKQRMNDLVGMYRRLVLIGLCLCLSALQGSDCFAQHLALKSNLFADALGSPNGGLELKLGDRATLDLSGHYYPFYNRKSDSRKRHWLLQPGIRFWSCESFSGWFWGIHVLGGEFNLSSVQLPFGVYKGVRANRYEGFVLGGGLSLGYQWVLSSHWGVEAELGGGYVHARYDRYYCAHCGEKMGKGVKHYIGPTKVAVSLVYVLR